LFIALNGSEKSNPFDDIHLDHALTTDWYRGSSIGIGGPPSGSEPEDAADAEPTASCPAVLHVATISAGPVALGKTIIDGIEGGGI